MDDGAWESAQQGVKRGAYNTFERRGFLTLSKYQGEARSHKNVKEKSIAHRRRKFDRCLEKWSYNRGILAEKGILAVALVPFVGC